MSKKLEGFKKNTLHTIGFILHTADIHKPTGAFIMKYLDDFFWIFLLLCAVSIVSNLFIA